MTPWSARASAVEPTDSTFAETAASIGATTFAFAATARSTGAARSRARSRLTKRSSNEKTSLSGSNSPASAAISSAVNLGVLSYIVEQLPGVVIPTGSPAGLARGLTQTDFKKTTDPPNVGLANGRA